MKMDFSQPCPPTGNIQDLEGAFEQLWTLCHKLLLKVNVAESRQQAQAEEWAQERDTLRSENARLKEKISDLNEQLRLNSKNSSKPPSSDYPSGKPPSAGNTGCSAKGRIRVPSRDEKKRKPGGQPGHKGHYRKLLPEAEVDRVEQCLPPSDCVCGGHVMTTPHYRRHQVNDIPEPKSDVIEYQLVEGVCNLCKKQHVGKLPPGVSQWMLGPRALGLLSTWAKEFHMSKRLIQLSFKAQHGLSISVGSVSNMEHRLANIFKAPEKEIAVHVQSALNKHVDETGHKNKGIREWMWVASTMDATYFRIDAERTGRAAMALLGEWVTGIVVTDRYGSYNWIPNKKRQVCFAHVLRDFIRISEREGEAGRLGKALVLYTYRLFRAWHRFKDGKINRLQWERYANSLQKTMEKLLDKGTACSHQKTARTCKNLVNNNVSLWLFVTKPGVEPTNNQAEQRLRHYVIWRKLSFGTRSDWGKQYLSRLLTIAATCRQQQRPVWETLTEIIRCHFLGQPPPRLIVSCS